MGGALAPHLATTLIGAIGLGAALNFGQYIASQLYHKEEVTLGGISWALLTGAFGGRIGGTNTVLKELAYLNQGELTRQFIGNPKLFAAAYQAVYRDEVLKAALKQVMGANGIRTLLAGDVSNLPSDVLHWLVEKYKELTGEEWKPDTNQSTQTSVPTSLGGATISPD